MILLDPWFISSNAFILLLALYFEFHFRSLNNYQFSRPLILVGILLSLMLPFLSSISSPSIGFAEIKGKLLEVIPFSSTAETISSFNWIYWITAIWLLGVGVQFLSILFQLLKLFKIISASKKTDSYFILEDSQEAFSFFGNIFIGDAIPKEKIPLLIRHEKIHIQKWHSLDRIFIEVLRIAFWFNPGLYLLKNQLEEIHEFEADELSQIEPEKNIELLLQQRLGNYHFSLTHSFNKNHLKNRIMRIQKKQNNPIQLKTILITASLFGLMLFSSQIANSNVNVKVKYAKTIDGGDLDNEAKYPGGQAALVSLIQKNLKYPKEAEKNNIQETIFLELMISEKGVVTSVTAIKGNSQLLKDAAIASLKNMENWIPAMKDGKAVKSKLTLPIKFELPKEKK